MPHLKRWLLHGALIFAGLAIGVAIFEVVLRLAGIAYPNFYVPNPYTGYRLKAGAEGWYTEEGRAYVRINSDGLHDREHTRQKPPNTLRIAVLGDSFTEAKQVPLEDAYWAVMADSLPACSALSGRDIEVINFGVSGYGTLQELLTLRHYVWQYNPDVVLLAFFTGDDVQNSFRPLEQHTLRPFASLRDGELVFDTSFTASPDYRLGQSWAYRTLDYSRVLQISNQVRKTLFTKYRNEAQDWDAVYTEPQDPLWREGWAVAEQLLRLMHREVEAEGAQFVVVTLSTPIQAHPDPAVRRDYMAKIGVDDLFYPDTRLRNLGQQDGFPVINLAPYLQTYAEAHQVYLHGFANTAWGTGHWNAQGHRVAGQRLADEMCDRLGAELSARIH